MLKAQTGLHLYFKSPTGDAMIFEAHYRISFFITDPMFISIICKCFDSYVKRKNKKIEDKVQTKYYHSKKQFHNLYKIQKNLHK